MRKEAVTLTKGRRPLYEPPRARDLSASGASGWWPLGNCVDGAAPGIACNPQGAGIGPHQCGVGSLVHVKCKAGSVP